MALALLCTANFMVILDAQVVLLAIPSIADDLGLAAGDAQWVLSAYMLSFGGLLLLGGRAADLLGRRRTFMGGTVLFLLASLLCGLAWNGGLLVGARVLQGVSAALMTPSALSILTTTFQEGAERNKALAVWAGTGGFGATAALLIGGVLTDGLGWPWIFFLNVPVALGMLVLSPALLRESRDRARARAYDPAGAVTITAALALGLYAIVEAPEAGWASVQTVGLLAVSAGLGALFTLVEAGSVAPLVPLRIFRSRTLTGGNLVTALTAMCAYGMSLVVSAYAQRVLGYTPAVFGLGTAVMPLMAVVGSSAGQALVTRAGSRPVAAAGMALMGMECLLLAQISTDGSYFGDLFAGQLLFGLGLGSTSVAAASAALGGVAESESGVASGINTAAFQLGGAVGVAVATTVAVARTAQVWPGAVRQAPPAALTEGFQSALMVGVGFAILGLLVSTVLLGRARRCPVGRPRTKVPVTATD